MPRTGVVCLAILLCFPGCHHREQFTQPVMLGGRPVAADILNHGREVYQASCESCHGSSGGGDGLKAGHMQPPPRNLKLGLYEFASVPAGDLPTDFDLMRIVKNGLQGTGMPATNLNDEDLVAVVQYLKTFSPRWQRDAAGQPLHSVADLSTSAKRLAQKSKQDWIDEGERVYHVDARCWSCHPAYETKQYLYEASSRRITSFRPDLYEARVVPSEFGYPLKATDFLSDTLRAGTSEDALFRTIVAGLGGTGMDSARENLDDTRIWSLVYYVQSLIDQKEQHQADELRAKLHAQIDWQPGQ